MTCIVMASAAVAAAAHCLIALTLGSSSVIPQDDKKGGFLLITLIFRIKRLLAVQTRAFGTCERVKNECLRRRRVNLSCGCAFIFNRVILASF